VLSNTSTWTMKKNGRGGYELSQDEIPVANFWNEHTARLAADILNADSTAEKLHQLMTARAQREDKPKRETLKPGKSHWYHGR
jgi:hypothetical protein